MSQIRTTARQITALEMLIIMQGFLTIADRTLTAENIDNKLALHDFGRALFVQKRLPLAFDRLHSVAKSCSSRAVSMEIFRRSIGTSLHNLKTQI